MSIRFILTTAAACLALTGVLVAGCGSASESSASAPTAADLESQIEQMLSGLRTSGAAAEACVSGQTVASAAEARCLSVPYNDSATIEGRFVTYLDDVADASSGTCATKLKALASAYRPLVADQRALAVAADAGDAAAVNRLLASPAAARHAKVARATATAAAGKAIVEACS